MSNQQNKQKKYVLAVDVGGTNTDSVLVDVQKNQIISKSKEFTSEDTTQGIIKSIKSCLDSSQNINTQEILSITIGTTHFINAILQKRNNSNHQDILNKVSVVRLCGLQTFDFPPFSSFENEELKERMQGCSYLLDGGYYFDGERQYTDFDEAQVLEIAEKIILSEIKNIAIVGTFSILNDYQEKRTKELLQQYFQEKNYDNVSFTLSSEISKREGILERENAAIINESLKYIAHKTFYSYQQALKTINLDQIPFFISHNDGSIMTIETALEKPIFTFSSSIVNSLKGGAELFKCDKDVIVVDIGGTSTDISVMNKGIPLTANKSTQINGIQLNFRTPLVHTLALGGGSMVEVTKNQDGKPQVEIKSESIAYRLVQEAVSFQKNKNKQGTLCNTDFAIYSNPYLHIPGAQKSLFTQYLNNLGFQKEEEIQFIVNEHKRILTSKVLAEIETLINSGQQTNVIFVGGGVCLIDPKYIEELSNNMCKVVKIDSKNEIFQSVANAYGASLADITESIEKDIYMNPNGGPTEFEIVEQLQKQIIEKVKQKGSSQNAEIVEIIVSKKPYTTELNSKTVYIKAKGRFDWKLKNLSQQKPLQETFRKPSPNATKTEEKTNYLFQLPSLPPYQKSVQRHLAPVLTLQNEQDFEFLAWGCAILGSGGGGSVEKSLLQCKLLFNKQNKSPFHIYDPLTMNENDLLCTVGHFGAPSVSLEYCNNVQELYGVYECLNKYMSNKINGIACSELGGCNGVSCLVLSLATGIPLFDCNIMCRAFPEYRMTLPSINGISGLPICLGDSKHNRFLIDNLYQKGEAQYLKLEQIMRNWVLEHFGLAGNLASYPSDKEFIKENYFFQGYQLCYQIGKVLYENIHIKQKSVLNTFLEDFKQIDEKVKVIISGKIIHSKRMVKNGYDFGELIIKQINNDSKDDSCNNTKQVKIVYKNEYLLAYNLVYNQNTKQYDEEPLPYVMTPDIITLVDDFKGQVIHSEDVCFGQRVIALAIRTDDKFKTPQALKLVGPQAMGLGVDFEYKPFY